ncbi:hypothetical protein GUY44_22475 [Pimelobacter simplex]|uniref:Uncharacterized protein n=1 Tax=Nocardioides simplex TaxID=2045 RepID=A0A0A1DPP7_NOCSI|nr:hypothetical protein [Pimelobacter simplex]AIY18562.1 hypothetical protein KR76_20615 [Pimelobacter simplex]MCG8153265.1 hypothetical protein [Pimelobacter simplex]GEB14199.1 hypothetical protein NSI01_25140 [Pimelobacter simplex]SFM32532.1 hypothetical protein SAMN05421671_1221 [Pimelobacter simplex]
MHAVAVTAVHALLAAEDKKPEDNDVVAGWTGFVVFVVLILAVAVIGWALTRSLRNAGRAKDAGMYGDEPVDTTQEPGADDAK